MNDFALRNYKVGDIGQITVSHSAYYHAHWSLDSTFEVEVASELAEFVNGFDKKKDGLWVAEYEGKFAGAIAIAGKNIDIDGARLRWFIVEQPLQGKGIGQLLIQRAVDFCREKNYKKITLWTFAGLDPARILYERAGFRLIEATPKKLWGRSIMDQKFELVLA